MEPKIRPRRPVGKVKPNTIFYWLVMDGMCEGKVLEGFKFMCKYENIEKVRCMKTGIVIRRSICMRQGKVDVEANVLGD